jgi:hypothetical protein
MADDVTASIDEVGWERAGAIIAAAEKRLLSPGEAALLRRRIVEVIRARPVRPAESERLKVTLARDFGKHKGWTWVGRDRGVQHLFGKRPEDYSAFIRPPYWDHPSSFTAPGRRPGHATVALVSQPYDVDDEKRDTMMRWAAHHGLIAEISDELTWWYPGWTTLCVFTRKPAIVST